MNLELTKIFVKVVQNGSFSKAASLLNLPKSTVSKAITKLEKDSGTKLLLRTTRSLTLTAAGRAFFDAASGPIQTIEDAQKSLQGNDSIISGTLRITAPDDLGNALLAPKFAELILKHPDLKFDLHYTDKVIDLVKDGFDLAVRIGRLTESSFKVKKAGEVKLILVASSKYLKDKEKLKHPKDLASHSCLSYGDQAYRKWTLKSPTSTATIQIEPKIASNQMFSLMNAALNHGGIALIPKYLCQKEIDSGRLLHVLPDWSTPGIPVSIVTPLSPSSSARLKLLVDDIHKTLISILD